MHSGVDLQQVVDAMNVTAKGGQPTAAQVTAMLSVAGLNIGFGLIGALILSQFFSGDIFRIMIIILSL
ncbi:hypothetical protein ACRQ5D_23565 [Mucilaginibacter sp. P25]